MFYLTLKSAISVEKGVFVSSRIRKTVCWSNLWMKVFVGGGCGGGGQAMTHQDCYDNTVINDLVIERLFQFNAILSTTV